MVPDATHVAVTGKPNTGKTLLVRRLAAYVGAADEVAPSSADGAASVEQAVVSATPFSTRVAWAFPVTVRVAGQQRRLLFWDTVGLSDAGPVPLGALEAMGQTLELLAQVDMVLHLVDAAALGRGQQAAFGAVDREMVAYGPAFRAFAVLAAKADRPEARVGARALRRLVPRRTPVILVSGLTGQGLKAVRAFILARIR
jgi:50S ribosomal subunit-associated GTPase HflX